MVRRCFPGGVAGLRMRGGAAGPDEDALVPGRIVFETYRDGNGEIYSMEADGSGPDEPHESRSE